MKMSMNEFEALCGRYLIAPDIALENETIVDCLIGMRDTKDDSAANGYRNALINALETEF
jgi:hypothetical protein